MSEQLYHHGIKGMRWGVRRTPQQLGHVMAKKVPSGEKKVPKTVGTKTPGKAFLKSTSISDEELQRRINRLNMEERYDDLVTRQNARNNKGLKATAKKLLANSAEDLGRQLLGVAVKKLIDRIGGEKKFDIDKYKDVDINEMDSDTIAKVSKWYGDAMKIGTARSKLSPDSSSSNSSSSSDSSSGTDYTRRSAWGSTPTTRSQTTRQQTNEWLRQRNKAIKDLKR